MNLRKVYIFGKNHKFEKGQYLENSNLKKNHEFKKVQIVFKKFFNMIKDHEYEKVQELKTNQDFKKIVI